MLKGHLIHLPGLEQEPSPENRRAPDTGLGASPTLPPVGLAAFSKGLLTISSDQGGLGGTVGSGEQQQQQWQGQEGLMAGNQDPQHSPSNTTEPPVFSALAPSAVPHPPPKHTPPSQKPALGQAHALGDSKLQ